FPFETKKSVLRFRCLERARFPSWYFVSFVVYGLKRHEPRRTRSNTKESKPPEYHISVLSEIAQSLFPPSSRPPAEAGIFLAGSHPIGGSMAAVKITVRKNGPYRVEAPEGSIELVDADGNKYDLTGKPAFSLCRCGASVNKPFCDGTHSKMGFQAAEAAVKKSEESAQP